MQNCKLVSTPFPVNFKLSLNMSSSNGARKDGDVSSTVCINDKKLNVCHDLYKTRHRQAVRDRKSVHGKYEERAQKYG